MASEAVLKELFQVAKNSSSFRGVADAEIWKACMAYNDRSDDGIRIAIENIHKKDLDEKGKSEEKKAKLEAGKLKMLELHSQEAVDHQKDEGDAESILRELFRKI